MAEDNQLDDQVSHQRLEGGGVIMQLEERINNARSSFKIISMTYSSLKNISTEARIS